MKIQFFPIFLAVASGMSSCQGTKNTDSQNQSFVWAQSRWPNPRAIPVCVVNFNEISEDLLRDIRTHVTFEFGYKVGVGLIKWSPCSEQDLKSAMIRVYFNRIHDWQGSRVTSGGGLSMIGSSPNNCGPDCKGGSMRIDISKDGQAPALDHPLRDFILTQARAASLHEFGHALGLMHEHDRADASPCNDIQGSSPNTSREVFVGTFDANSIMNYCKDSSLTTLTDGDVGGLKFLYPELI